MLLLHGGGLSWWNYRRVAEQLQQDYRIILPVLDGHAGSDREFTSIEDNAAEIISFVDHRLGGSVLLFGGLSLGAQIPEELQYDYSLRGIDLDLAKKRLMLASVLQYTLPGVPVIYYGDEAGMQGHADPYNRAAYPWGKEDEEILYHYKKLGLIYKQHRALQTGDLKIYPMGDDIIALERSNEQEKMVVLVNRNWQNSIVVAADTRDFESAVDLYSGEKFSPGTETFLLPVEPVGARIIVLTDQ